MEATNNSSANGKSPSTLPTEMWNEVLTKLKHPNDLLHASQASPLWNALLHPKKTEFLFPQVVPGIVNYLSGKELLLCREVCKTWKGSVDYLLQHGPDPRNEVGESNHGSAAISPSIGNDQQLVPLAQVPRQHPIFAETTLTFTQVDEIIRYMERMGAVENMKGEHGQLCQSNPLPGRSVRFNPVTKRVHVNELLNYEDKMRAFLARYGCHIWYFQYTLPIHESPSDGRNMLIRLLQCVSNVRTIHLQEGFHWLRRQIMDGRHILDGDEGSSSTTRNKGQLPYPQLLSLLEISVPSSSMFHGEHMSGFVHAYMSQVRRVKWLADSTVGFKVMLDTEASLREQWRNQTLAIKQAEEKVMKEEEAEEKDMKEGEA